MMTAPNATMTGHRSVCSVTTLARSARTAGRSGGRSSDPTLIPIDQAYAAIASLSRGIFQALSPHITAMATACARISADPAVQALAAASAVVTAYWEDGAPPERPATQLEDIPRGFFFDPCGQGPIAHPQPGQLPAPRREGMGGGGHPA